MLDIDCFDESVLTKPEVISSSPTKYLTQTDVEYLRHQVMQHEKPIVARSNAWIDATLSIAKIKNTLTEYRDYSALMSAMDVHN